MAQFAQRIEDAFVADIPCIIKSSKSADGKRMIEVQASSEDLDAEGDVIAQAALLGSAQEFVKTGHLDIDHLSELGPRMGIRNPESYIIGRPTEVKDMGGGKTSVVGEIFRSKEGHDPEKNRFDAFWDSLQTTPAVKWRASVYGFPKGNMVDDCREKVCNSNATRFHIKGMSWRSLALTRNPVNESLTGYAKILKASTYLELVKAANTTQPYLVPFDGNGADVCVGEPCSAPLANSMLPGPAAATAPIMMSHPRDLMDALGQYHGHMKSECPYTEGLNTTAGFKAHFEKCCGMEPSLADVWGHALMHKTLLHRRRT